jgi:formylglycine-generating enzyme required for sulfatase activity
MLYPKEFTCQARSRFRRRALVLSLLAVSLLPEMATAAADVGQSPASALVPQSSIDAQAIPLPEPPNATLPPIEVGLLYLQNVHSALSQRAIDRPECLADGYLKDRMGLPYGIVTLSEFGSQALWQAFCQGAVDEDVPVSQVLNHFYNPIPSNKNGLNDYVPSDESGLLGRWFHGHSALQWAYDDPSHENVYDWRAARDAFYRSLTATSSSDRQGSLFTTFECLGHVVHLLQDMAVPSHTRNDAHLSEEYWGPGAPYEQYVEDNYGSVQAVDNLPTVAGLPYFADPAVVAGEIPSGFSAYWDTGQYTGQAGFQCFNGSPGLAEFSNLRFLSDDTMMIGGTDFAVLQRFVCNEAPPGMLPLRVKLIRSSNNRSYSANHRFPNPRIFSTNLACKYPNPARVGVVLSVVGDGVTNVAFYVDLATCGGIQPNLFAVTTDDEIGFDNVTYDSAAQILLPQALAYSTSLINWFFRGEIGTGCCGATWDPAQSRWVLEITNESVEAFTEGAWELLSDDENGDRSPVDGFDAGAYGGALAPQGSFTATFPDVPNASAFTLVFRGKIGDEENAVATKGVSGCGVDMVRIPAGTFTMGSPTGEPGRLTNETQHQVTLTRAICVSKYEVTQAQWQAVMGWNESYFPGANRPVEKVSWYDVVSYCNQRSTGEGLTPAYAITNATYNGNHITAATVSWNQAANGYRLPTEAEWEYACRAGSTTAFANGPITQYNYCAPIDPNLDQMGWYCGNASSTTHDVGGKMDNAWGLYDMHGNVVEWCWDWYGAYEGNATDPVGPGAGSGRVGRGGSWYHGAQNCRSANRSYGPPNSVNFNIGFRPVRSVF